MSKHFRVLMNWKREHEKPTAYGFKGLDGKDSHTLQIQAGQALIDDEITVAEAAELYHHTIVTGSAFPELIELLKQNGVFDKKPKGEP